MLTLTLKEVRKFIEKNGYKLLSDEYINSRSYITVQCPNSHPPYSTTFSNFYIGSRCPICGSEQKRKPRIKWTDDKIGRYLEKEGYSLNHVLMKNNRKYIRITCPNNHTYTVTLDNYLRGRRCGYCKKKGVQRGDHNEIAHYYLSHTQLETANKFGINADRVSVIFNANFGCSKSQYISSKSDDDF